MLTESEIRRQKKTSEAPPAPTANGRSHTPLPGHCRTLRLLDPGVCVSRKVILDRLAAGILLAVSFPLILLAMLLVKLTSRGPAIYSQKRVGLGGLLFTIYKIRTMTHNCEHHSGVRWAVKHDARVTPVGRFLRRTHIDELLQLWNVVRGDMSLVGPRPERPEFVPRLEEVIPLYRYRLLVRPGVTGLAQVQLPADTDMASVRRKLAYDLYYVEHLGLPLDLKILLATGLYLVHVPFAWWQRALGVPTGEPVESTYQALTSEANGKHHRQRA